MAVNSQQLARNCREIRLMIGAACRGRHHLRPFAVGMSL
jgi:hypothetical protein